MSQKKSKKLILSELLGFTFIGRPNPSYPRMRNIIIYLRIYVIKHRTNSPFLEDTKFFCLNVIFIWFKTLKVWRWCYFKKLNIWFTTNVTDVYGGGSQVDTKILSIKNWISCKSNAGADTHEVVDTHHVMGLYQDQQCIIQPNRRKLDILLLPNRLYGNIGPSWNCASLPS